jgi:hypothetical protein
MPTASVSDVEGVIDVDLSSSTTSISDFLEDAEFDAKQEINDYSSSLTTEEKRQLEKYLASLYIREWVDRAVSSTSRETASVNYEGPSLAALRRQVDRRDPSGKLASRMDTNRYVNSGP